MAHLKQIVSTSVEFDYEQLLKNIPSFILQMYRQDFNAPVDYAAVYFYDQASNQYKLFSYRARSKARLSLAETFFKTDAIPLWFGEKVHLFLKEGLIEARYREAVRDADLSRLRLAFGFKKKEAVFTALNNLKRAMKSAGAQACVPCFYKDRLLAFMLLGRKQKGFYSQEELDAFALLAHDLAIVIRGSELRSQVEQSYIDAIHAIITALEERDAYTKGHSERVVKYAEGIARELKRAFPFSRVANLQEEVKRAALLHDVGKIGLPDEILLKKGKFTAEELRKMKAHPQTGITIIKSIRSLSDEVKEGIESHHERFDGTGYSKGLKGHMISPLARIIAVADAYDAMTTDRPYRKALSPLEAIREMLKFTYVSGRHWDPKVVEAHLAALKKEPSYGVTEEMIQSIRSEMPAPQD